MDRDAGSYIIDEEGHIKPNEDDEAMAERLNLKKKIKKDKEVKTNVHD